MPPTIPIKQNYWYPLVVTQSRFHETSSYLRNVWISYYYRIIQYYHISSWDFIIYCHTIPIHTWYHHLLSEWLKNKRETPLRCGSKPNPKPCPLWHILHVFFSGKSRGNTMKHPFFCWGLLKHVIWRTIPPTPPFYSMLMTHGTEKTQDFCSPTFWTNVQCPFYCYPYRSTAEKKGVKSEKSSWRSVQFGHLKKYRRKNVHVSTYETPVIAASLYFLTLPFTNRSVTVHWPLGPPGIPTARRSFAWRVPWQVEKTSKTMWV